MTVSAPAAGSAKGSQSLQCLLVGVLPGQSPAVAAEAAKLSVGLGRALVCAPVNFARYLVSESADGSVISEPVNPDFMDDVGASFPATLTAALEQHVSSTQMQWRTAMLAGAAEQDLARCTETLDASMIVVGTSTDNHQPLHKILSRSVAARLSRARRRPVLVVPVHHGYPTQDGP